MTTALIGVTGQLGTDLAGILGANVVPVNHHQMELADSESVEANLNRIRPGVVINTAAYNLVDKAEDCVDEAMAVNALGPARLARWCEQNGATLVHFSTDYVFGNSEVSESDETQVTMKRPCREIDLPVPDSVYAASKFSGENLVRSICSRHFVIRTCGLYGIAATKGAGKGNFIETMLRLGRERDELSVVNDQHCTPTSTRDLAQATAELIETGKHGLYHATNSGATTWYELASEVFRQSGVEVRLRPITTAEFGARAARPAYSVLDCSKLTKVIGRPMPDWRDAVSRYLSYRQQTDS